MLIVASHPSPTYVQANAQPMVSFRNLMTEGNLTDALLPATAPRANAVTQGTFDFWLPASVPADLRTTLAQAETADCAFFAGHTLGSAGATVTVQYFNGAAWVDLASHAPADDKPFGFVWPSLSATGWGVRIAGAVAQIAVAWIGPRLIIPGGVLPDYVPVWSAIEYERLSGVSRRGQFFGQRIERKTARLSPSFMDIPYSFAVNDMAAFRKHHDEGNAFVWASAPSVFPDDAAYVSAVDNSAIRCPIRSGGDWCGLSMDLEAYVA